MQVHGSPNQPEMQEVGGTRMSVGQFYKEYKASVKDQTMPTAKAVIAAIKYAFTGKTSLQNQAGEVSRQESSSPVTVKKTESDLDKGLRRCDDLKNNFEGYKENYSVRTGLKYTSGVHPFLEQFFKLDLNELKNRHNYHDHSDHSGAVETLFDQIKGQIRAGGLNYTDLDKIAEKFFKDWEESNQQEGAKDLPMTASHEPSSTVEPDRKAEASGPPRHKPLPTPPPKAAPPSSGQSAPK